MASDTVAVGCRLIHGLHLRITDATGAERRITLNGANKSQLIGGCGITEVPRDFWDAWLKINKAAPFLVNGTIFATRSLHDTAQEGKSREREKTGFEGADPREVDRKLEALSRE